MCMPIVVYQSFDGSAVLITRNTGKFGVLRICMILCPSDIKVDNGFRSTKLLLDMVLFPSVYHKLISCSKSSSTIFTVFFSEGVHSRNNGGRGRGISNRFPFFDWKLWLCCKEVLASTQTFEELFFDVSFPVSSVRTSFYACSSCSSSSSSTSSCSSCSSSSFISSWYTICRSGDLSNMNSRRTGTVRKLSRSVCPVFLPQFYQILLYNYIYLEK